MYHSLLIIASIHVHLGSSHLLAFVDDTDLNTQVQILIFATTFNGQHCLSLQSLLESPLLWSSDALALLRTSYEPVFP